MTIKKLKNGDVMVIIPARQKRRWKVLMYCAEDWLGTLPKMGYQEQHAYDDARKLMDIL